MPLDQRSLNIVLQHVEGKDIADLALNMAQEIALEFNANWKAYQKYWHNDFTWTETCTLALTFRNILWEIKEYGELRTHPESLLSHATAQMRDYKCRGYSFYLTLFVRAFARQLCEFNNLPRREFGPSNDPCGHWYIYDSGMAARNDYSARQFQVESVYSHDEFGETKDFLGYYVCESLYGFFDCSGEDDIHPDYVQLDEFYKVVPFDSKGKAKFFVACLVELLNDGYGRKNEEGWYEVDYAKDDYIHQAAAQLIRETLAQAPVEETRIREEEEAKARAERLEKERIQREKAERKAAERAKIFTKMCTDSHVYIFHFDTGFTKFGKGNNVFARANKIKEGAPISIIKWACTEPIHESQALKFERQCKKHFADKNIQKLYPERKYNTTENFEISFEEAVEYLKSLTPIGYISEEPL